MHKFNNKSLKESFKWRTGNFMVIYFRRWIIKILRFEQTWNMLFFSFKSHRVERWTGDERIIGVLSWLQDRISARTFSKDPVFATHNSKKLWYASRWIFSWLHSKLHQMQAHAVLLYPPFWPLTAECFKIFYLPRSGEILSVFQIQNNTACEIPAGVLYGNKQ